MAQSRSLLSPAWFQSLYGSVTKVVGGLWTRLGGQGWTRFRFLMPGSRFDYEREAGDLWLNPICGLCIDWLGNRFTRPLLHVSKINQRTRDHVPLGRHPLTDLWNRPNKHYGRRTMEKAVGLSLKCDGNAYIYKVRDNGLKVTELWWIPHYRILPTWPPDGSEYIDGYRVWLDTNVYWLPAADVIHIRDGIDPRNERLGLCALRAAIREVCTINEESGYRAALLRNFCVPGLAIVPEGDGTFRPTQEDADDIRENFKEKFGGDNRGSTAVFGGPYKVIKIGFSPEEMSLKDFPVVPTARILGTMGVAAMSVNLPDENKTYSNKAESDRASWGSIVSTQELVAEHLRWELLPEFNVDPNDYTIEYDYTHIQELQETLDSLHNRAREDWKSGLTTQNEAREMIGLEPSDDGDRYFPGTGDPAEQAIQDQQHQERLAVLQNRLALPKPQQDQDDEDGERGQGAMPIIKPGKNGKSREAGKILKEEPALNGKKQLGKPELKTNSDERSFGCLMIGVDQEIADRIIQWSKQSIPDDMLYTGKSDAFDDFGRETWPHITVAYGFSGVDPNDVRAFMIGRNPTIRPVLGAITKFDSDENFDVIKIDVESENLTSLHNALIDRFDVQDTHKVYRPHVTIAYVKKGAGDNLVGSKDFAGNTFKAIDFVYSDEQNAKTVFSIAELAGSNGSKRLDLGKDWGRFWQY